MVEREGAQLPAELLLEEGARAGPWTAKSETSPFHRRMVVSGAVLAEDLLDLGGAGGVRNDHEATGELLPRVDAGHEQVVHDPAVPSSRKV